MSWRRQKILFVCMGNICRSPAALVVVRYAAERAGVAPQVELDSAGSHGYHAGEAPDRRMQQAARRRGYDLSRLRARKVGARDLEASDLILAMDNSNLAALQKICPAQYLGKLDLFLRYAGCPEAGPGAEVPDPYYGGPDGFERVLDLLEAGAAGLIERLQIG